MFVCHTRASYLYGYDESRPIRYIGPGSGNGPPQCDGSQLKAITLNFVGIRLYSNLPDCLRGMNAINPIVYGDRTGGT